MREEPKFSIDAQGKRRRIVTDPKAREQLKKLKARLQEQLDEAFSEEERQAFLTRMRESRKAQVDE